MFRKCAAAMNKIYHYVPIELHTHEANWELMILPLISMGRCNRR